jgi:hypothetical protein|tara:strand:+ start:283 stop:912 length:630 start_codon:yes stop_codon:yes gene_type:complete
MSVINYVSGDRYVLLIVNQNAAQIWGTQDALVKGYRISGEKEKKTSALEDVFVFPSIDKCLKMIQEYVDLQADMRESQVRQGGDYEGRYVAVSAGPLNDIKEAASEPFAGDPRKIDGNVNEYMWFETDWKDGVVEKVQDNCDGNLITRKITYPVKQVTPQIKDYVTERAEAGLATQGHIILWASQKDLDSRRQDIRLYEWLIIPVGGEE